MHGKSCHHAAKSFSEKKILTLVQNLFYPPGGLLKSRATAAEAYRGTRVQRTLCLAASAGVAAVETLVAGACSDHYHAAVVAGGRVRLGIERQQVRLETTGRFMSYDSLFCRLLGWLYELSLGLMVLDYRPRQAHRVLVLFRQILQSEISEDIVDYGFCESDLGIVCHPCRLEPGVDELVDQDPQWNAVL